MHVKQNFNVTFKLEDSMGKTSQTKQAGNYYSSGKKVTGNTKKVPFLGDENLKKGDENSKKGDPY